MTSRCDGKLVEPNDRAAGAYTVCVCVSVCVCLSLCVYVGVIRDGDSITDTICYL